MANTITYYNTVQTHYFKQDTTIVAGFSSPTFNRNFRVLDVTCFVVTAAPGATLTLNRIRGGATAAVCVLDVSGTGRAVITADISQTVGLFESGDTLQFISNSAAIVTNTIVYLQQFSI
jgi:uncharacterized metal-binding protein